MTYQRQYAYSHIHTPAGADSAIVVTGALRYASLDAAAYAAEHGQPTERSTRWNDKLTSNIGELSDWRIGTVVAPDHEVIVVAHPAEADDHIVIAALRLARTRAIDHAHQDSTFTPRTMRQQVVALRHEPAPKYLSDEQMAKLNEIRARNGHAPYPRAKLDAAAERMWRKARTLT